LGYTAQSHFLRLSRVTQTLGAHWGLKIWFFLDIKCLRGSLVYLDSLSDSSLVALGGSWTSVYYYTCSDGSLVSLGDSLYSLTAGSPVTLARSFDACPIVPSLHSVDLSTHARWLACINARQIIRRLAAGPTALVLLEQNGQQNKRWVIMGANSNPCSDGSAKPATGGVRDAHPCSGGNAKPAAVAVGDPHQNFETPHPVVADLALPPLV
jgi:hypothetical protein